MINVFSYQVRNGKRYDTVEINETIEENQLPNLLQEYRKRVGSKTEIINDKVHHDPDVIFCYQEAIDTEKEKKVPQAANKPSCKEFKQTTKTTKELIRFLSRE